MLPEMRDASNAAGQTLILRHGSEASSFARPHLMRAHSAAFHFTAGMHGDFAFRESPAETTRSGDRD